jgi:hypothetical protein
VFEELQKSVKENEAAARESLSTFGVDPKTVEFRTAINFPVPTFTAPGVVLPAPGPQTTSPRGRLAPKPRRNGLARSWSSGYNLIPARDKPGFGSLKVENGTEWDAVIKLVARKKGGGSVAGDLCRFVYVCAGAAVTVLGVGAGTYELFYCVGTHWNGARQCFDNSVAAARFEKPLAFAEGLDKDGIRYSSVEVTLHSVPGGQAHTSHVDQQLFDAIQ